MQSARSWDCAVSDWPNQSSDRLPALNRLELWWQDNLPTRGPGTSRGKIKPSLKSFLFPILVKIIIISTSWAMKSACYSPVSINISILHLLFIPIQQGSHVSNTDLYAASFNTTQYGLRFLKFTGPRLWNSLPTSMTNSNSLRIFRKTLKNSMLICYCN